MKVKEVNYSITGTIPVASYQNLKPFYSMTIQVEEGDNPEELFKSAQKQLKCMFDAEASAAKADYIKALYENIRFYTTPEGKKYPSVTSILGWDSDWRVTEDELRQYASRGTIVHKLSEEYLKQFKWTDPTEYPELQGDIATLMTGSLKFHWDDCSHKEFFAACIKDFQFESTETVLINDELQFAGRCDGIGIYQGKKSIIDFKTGTTKDFRQLAAYASCVPGIEQLVICPIGPSTTKQGYSKPAVCTDIKKEFDGFKAARTAFRKRFGC